MKGIRLILTQQPKYEGRDKYPTLSTMKYFVSSLYMCLYWSVIEWNEQSAVKSHTHVCMPFIWIFIQLVRKIPKRFAAHLWICGGTPVCHCTHSLEITRLYTKSQFVEMTCFSGINTSWWNNQYTFNSSNCHCTEPSNTQNHHYTINLQYRERRSFTIADIYRNTDCWWTIRIILISFRRYFRAMSIDFRVYLFILCQRKRSFRQ